MTLRFNGIAVALVVAVFASACAQDNKSGLSAKRGEPLRSKGGTVTILSGKYHCAAIGHPDADKYSSCLGVPVVVLEKDDGGCLALFPYRTLVIHTKRLRTKVQWRILGLQNSSFDPMDGVFIKDPASDGTTPRSAIWDGRAHDPVQKVFEWSVKAGVPDQEFYHLPMMKGPTGAPCEPIDPIMINVEN